ncbi:MAG: hypothetical protein EBR07_00060 [Planctomycetes bacterium]|nr:hypothetical protein [Planctomycetota bacterium]
MIYLAVIALTFLLSACASSTAQIAHAANASRVSVGAAREHLVAANAELDQIEAQCQLVSEAIPYVSDDVPAIMSTLQYVSIAVVAAVIGALIYTYIPRGR